MDYSLAPNGKGYASEDPQRLSERVAMQAKVVIQQAVQALDLKQALKASATIARAAQQQLGSQAEIEALGLQMHDRLMDAYWAEARNIGDLDELRALAAEVGIDDPDTAWDEPLYLERVLASSAQAHSIGVTGVPGFLLDRRVLVLGAQPRELFEQAFEQLRAGA